MVNLTRILLATWTLALFAAASAQERNLVQAPDGTVRGKAYARVHALLIGVNKYPALPRGLQLSYAVNDATALQKVLKEQYGFADVTLLTDAQATLSAMRTALSSFADNTKIKPDDLVLVYFSGHGQTVPTASGGTMGFLIPSDAKVDLNNPTNSAPYLDTCLPMKQVWDYLDLSPAKHAVVIADACFSGLLARTRGGSGLSNRALEVMLAKRARQVITGGAGGQKTAERDDIGHGVFTAKLIDELNARAAAKNRAFTLSDLFASLQEQVSNATEGKQTPQMGNFDSDGEVVFVPSATAEAPKADPPKTDPPKTDPPKADPRKTDPPKTDPPKTEPGKVPAGLSKKQGEYYLRIQEMLTDGANRFANLSHKKNKTSRMNGPTEVSLWELTKPLPNFSFGGVSDPAGSEVYLYFEGAPANGMPIFNDYKAAIRALMPGGREQHFDETNWRISDGTYQITLWREKEDTWRVEQVFQRMTLSIARIK